MKPIAISFVLVAGMAASSNADSTLSLELASTSPTWDRMTDSSLVPSTVCGNAIAFDSLNDGVPYALIRITTIGPNPFTVRADPLGANSLIDPFLAAFCSAPPSTLLLTADDDSGGFPSALLGGSRALPAGSGKTYYLMVTSYSPRLDRRYGKIKVSISGPAVLSRCTGDLNYDGVVDDVDFSVFVQAYNLLLCADPAMPAGCPGDMNGDGLVDDADFSVFVGAYNLLFCP